MEYRKNTVRYLLRVFWFYGMGTNGLFDVAISCSNIPATMNTALESSLSTNPFVKGILYADSNGLCISGIIYMEQPSVVNMCLCL